MTNFAQIRHNFASPHEVNYNIHISEEFKFIFFNNPKAGCSTTKATLNLACAARLGVDLRYTGMHDVHTRAFNLLKAPKDVGLQRFDQMVNDPHVVRFCVLREPISRIGSAYASKLRGNSPQRQRLNAFMNRPVGYDWADINEFVAAIASDTAIRDFDPHWRLQYRQVCAIDVPLTLVGFQEELDLSLRKLAQLVFGDENIEIFDARQHFPKSVSRSAAFVQTLTPESRRLLREAYADDFAFYRREWARMHDGAEVPWPKDEAIPAYVNGSANGKAAVATTVNDRRAPDTAVRVRANGNANGRTTGVAAASARFDAIARHLRDGRRHATLGYHPDRGEENWLDAGKDLAKRFIDTFGISPRNRVIDYGCGSMRIGAHFIRYLEPGNYFGLDVSAGLIDIGRELIGDDIMAERAPHLAAISESTLADAATFGADFIFSEAVAYHVFPDELEFYLSSLARLAHTPGCTLFFKVKLAGAEVKYWEGGSWARPLEAYTKPLLPLKYIKMHFSGGFKEEEKRTGIGTGTLEFRTPA